VEVDEIKPDGSSVQLTGDVRCARYRDSLTEEKLAKPGEINRYEFSGFAFFSRRIAKGSLGRVRVSHHGDPFPELDRDWRAACWQGSYWT